ncbi:MAG: hypothetical protein PHQ60_05540 [Sideroxydans sp.]|nr:hypothetical protein [Sideroxydans sp.]
MSLAIYSKLDCRKEFARVHNSLVQVQLNLNLQRFLDQFSDDQLHIAFDKLVEDGILEKRGDNYFIVETKL